MFTRPWEQFFKEKLVHIFEHAHEVLDIGGSLRIDAARNNRLDPHNAWIIDEIQRCGTSYKILDYVDTYHPDIVGDIQALPMPDNSQEAVLCIAVLEHVENPFKAAGELYRVLKPGGYCLVYVPFLYYYHAERGYYGDFWRYTRDSLEHLFKPFGTIEIQNVRGAFETWIRLSPLGRWRVFGDAAFLIDKATGKLNSKQTSGYYVFLRK